MRRAIYRAAALASLSPLALLAQSVKQTSGGGDPIPSGGDGTIYVGTYARNILVLDEATMRVRDTLHTTVGIPEISLSFDRKHLYVSDPGNEKVEIIDLATKQSLGMFTLSHDSVKVRMNGFSLDPMERFAVILVKIYTKHRDRYEVSAPDAAPLRSREARRDGHDRLAARRGARVRADHLLAEGRSDVLLHAGRRVDLRHQHAQAGRPLGDLENAVRGRPGAHQLRASLRRL